jgi:predicted extracellular nuclease
MYRGEWTLSADAPLRVPTEDAAPGSEAATLAGRNRENALPVLLPGPDFPVLPVGATVSHVQGVLGQHGEEQRLLLDSTPRAAVPDGEALEPAPEGHLRVVGLNLLNYFNGDGQGGGFPTARGAQSPEDFEEQQGRTAAAIREIQPHLLAVQELENDGFGPLSAAQSLVDLLNTTGSSDWAFIDPAVGPIGGDVITVGLFYRRQALEPVGPPELLNGPSFSGLSRVPLAQLFRERASGAHFLVAVNHLKSKGRCPEGGPNADQGDGQGCWNAARVEAVRALGPWLERLATKSGTRQVLILGDMNAWRNEDPIRSYRDAGYTELVETLSGLPQYSFVYFGQRGTLDYALVTPSLRKRARQAMIWHINADWPRNMALPRPWLRMSDHDPVVVDFDFSQSATSD